MGTVQAQGRSLSHPLLGYTMPQGLLQTGERVRSWERASALSVGQLGVLWGSSALREKVTAPPGSWGRRPDWCALLHPGEMSCPFACP